MDNRDKSRSEMRYKIMIILYQISLYEKNNIPYDVSNVIEEQMETENDFVNEIVMGVIEKKDEIALEVQKQVAEEMSTYGYIIVKTLITKVEPDAEVKQSMNEINAAQRKRVAAQELAEADKIKIVTAAEAEAEKDRLHGVGIAEQRKAIVDGLADSIKELKGANVELTEEQIMSILLTNQYLDTLNNFADKQGNNTIFLPANPNGVEDIRTHILSALKAK